MGATMSEYRRKIFLILFFLLALVIGGSVASIAFLKEMAEQEILVQLLARLRLMQPAGDRADSQDLASMAYLLVGASLGNTPSHSVGPSGEARQGSTDAALGGASQAPATELMNYVNPLGVRVYAVRGNSAAGGVTLYAEQEAGQVLATFHAARRIVLGFALLFAVVAATFAAFHIRWQRLSRLSERGRKAFGDCTPAAWSMPDPRGCRTHGNAPVGESRLLGETLELLWEQGTHALPASAAKARAEAAEKLDILSMIAHEIQTPISAIAGIAFLMKRARAEEMPGHVSRLIETSHYLSAVVRNALDLSRLESGRMDIQLRKFSLRGLVQHVFELVWDSAMENGVNLFTNLPPDVPDLLVGDDVRIKQILLNYIQNAIRHGGPGLVVLDIAADDDNPCVMRNFTFVVRDRGPGIEREELDRLFKPLPWIAGRSRAQGNGLGLNITRRIAELIGGQTWIDSRPGQGAACIAKLPLAVDVSQDAGFSVSQFAGKRIWVVDPSGELTAAIHAGLAARGARVDEAGGQRLLCPGAIANGSGDSGEAAPDYVIVDWRCFSQALMDRCDAMFKDNRARFIVLGPPLGSWTPDTSRPDRVHVRFKPTLLSETGARPFNPSATLKGNMSGQDCCIDKNWLARYVVLLVEDDDIVRSVFREILVLAGAEVLVAGDGFEALTILGHSHIDIVLMDLQMPGLSGFETARKIRAMPGMRELPIIVITANPTEMDRATASWYGVTCSLTKPANPSQLLELMRGLLERREGGGFGLADREMLADSPASGADACRAISAGIAALDEIRIDNALARLGGRHEIFVNIVRRVLERADSAKSPLAPLVESEDLGSATAAFHKLVSELGIIGAEPLQAWAAELESAARRSMLERSAVDAFVRRYRKLIADLRRVA
ncbi:Sensor histidine kinase RcsC [compost metagenome]